MAKFALKNEFLLQFTLKKKDLYKKISWRGEQGVAQKTSKFSLKIQTAIKTHYSVLAVSNLARFILFDMLISIYD